MPSKVKGSDMTDFRDMDCSVFFWVRKDLFSAHRPWISPRSSCSSLHMLFIRTSGVIPELVSMVLLGDGNGNGDECSDYSFLAIVYG